MKSIVLHRIFASVLVAGLLVRFATGAAAAVDVVCEKRLAIQNGGGSLDLAYCGNVDLAPGDASVVRAIVVVHGSSRNADDYLAYVRDAGIMAGNADVTTAIIAPQFLVEDDITTHAPLKDVLFWSSGGWKKGNKSKNTTANPRPFTVSSFEVVDRILEQLADVQAWPGITQIVVIGHSAGGQFANRYAAGNTAQTTLNGVRAELSFRYVVANPSSYLYLSPDRAAAGTTDSFLVPDPGTCPNYDDYKYGLQDLNNYMTNVGANAIKERYSSRNVVTFLGRDDNDPNHPKLASGCAAMLQGTHRRERGEIHFNHVQAFFGAEILARHRLDYVPGVGHSARRMFQSDCGLFHLYDFDPSSTCNSDDDNESIAAAISVINSILLLGAD